MAELSIRRNREIAAPKYQKMGKAAKQAGASQVASQRPAGVRTPATVSETLRRLMTRVDQAERYLREGRRTLQSGESALAEIEENLERMEDLARQAAGSGELDRTVLQRELERLTKEIDRIAGNGVKAGLFQEGNEDDADLDAMVDAVMEGLSAKQSGVDSLPDWMLRGMAGSVPSREELMTSLGLDENSSSAEVLAALSKLPLDGDSPSGYLASLYLGAVISGGAPSGAVDPAQAAEGLRQLLELVSDGMSLDEAMELLTGGAFSGMKDFQTQFTGGTAPGLDAMLMDLLFSGGKNDGLPDLMALLAGVGIGDTEMDLLMDLMSMLDGSGGGLMELLDQSGASDSGLGQTQTQNGAAQSPRLLDTARLGAVQAAGEDLSGVALKSESGAITVSGDGNVMLRGTGREAPVIVVTGLGDVTLQQIDSPLLEARSAQVRVVSAGEGRLSQVQVADGAALTLDGSGMLRIGQLRLGASGQLRITGGAVAVSGVEAQAGSLAAVVVDGPASLLAAEGMTVRNERGEPLTPFDIVWKTLLPEWNSISSLLVDGKQGPLNLRRDDLDDPVRLWLLSRDSEDKKPVHTIVLRGRDRTGRARTRYIYVRWDERQRRFQEVSMYPNPFTVTGGEQDVDWSYDEESHTLRILTREVTAISGGMGTDANLLPFSGRIALADGIGRVELTLDGVRCRVAEGRAFDLGRGNQVTLCLQRGTDSVFESGPGYAGISLGEGTSLYIDQTRGTSRDPDGTLTATGGSGGAGIGRDSSAGRELTGSIYIRNGVVTATGTGGGAGIGGALGGPVGDIRIQGGTVTAQASCSAAAIGAGIQGACGDIFISGSARVAKAQGGGPDGDIGGCLFGSCGKVQVSAGTDIGKAKIWTQKGISLQAGENSVTLPKFRVSAKVLSLNGLDISSRDAARAAMEVLTRDRRWVTRLQGAYGAMYGQLAQSFSGMYSVRRQLSVVRDNREASALSMDIREVLRLSPLAKFLQKRGMEDVGYLLR